MEVGDRIVVVGQSQGAGAAFATAAFQPAYAPDVRGLGTVATGLPYFSQQTLAAILRGGPSDKATPTLALFFAVAALAELTAPDFNPQPHLTETGGVVYALGNVA